MFSTDWIIFSCLCPLFMSNAVLIRKWSYDALFPAINQLIQLCAWKIGPGYFRPLKFKVEALLKEVHDAQGTLLVHYKGRHGQTVYLHLMPTCEKSSNEIALNNASHRPKQTNNITAKSCTLFFLGLWLDWDAGWSFWGNKWGAGKVDESEVDMLYIHILIYYIILYIYNIYLFFAPFCIVLSLHRFINLGQVGSCFRRLLIFFSPLNPSKS